MLEGKEILHNDKQCPQSPQEVNLDRVSLMYMGGVSQVKVQGTYLFLQYLAQVSYQAADCIYRAQLRSTMPGYLCWYRTTCMHLCGQSYQVQHCPSLGLRP